MGGQTMSGITTVMCLSIGTPKIINFPIVAYGKLFSGVPRFRHITV